MRSPLGLRAALPLAVAAAILAIAPFLDTRLWVLQWLAFVPFVLAVEGAGPGRAALVGWLTGLAVHLMGFYWFVDLLHRFAHLPLALCVVMFFLYAAWGGLGWMAVSLVVALLGRRRAGFPPLLVLPPAFMVMEFAFPCMFPWNVAGGQAPFLWFIQGAEVAGVLGLSGLLAASGAALYELLARPLGWIDEGPSTGSGERDPSTGSGTRGSGLRVARIAAAAVLLLVAAEVVWGAFRVRSVEKHRSEAPALRVGVVQPNVSMDEKSEMRFAKNQLGLLQDLSAAAESGSARIVVWPESGYPYRIHREVTSDLPHMRRIMSGFVIPVVFGAVSYDSTGRYNSAYLLTTDGTLVGPADKNHLVLFSEHIPFRDHFPKIVLERFPAMAYKGFQAGVGPGILEWENLRAGILVCFEDTLAGHGRQVVRAGANLLVNVTNDAWFGDTVEPHQHLTLSVFRAVENRRDMVRSVNTGVSAIVEATGRVAYRMEMFEEAVFVGDVRLLGIKTPFTSAGNWVGWASLAALVLLGLAATIRRVRRGRAGPLEGSTDQEVDIEK